MLPRGASGRETDLGADDDDDTRRQDRKDRNREAARASRLRRKAYIHELESTNARLQSEVTMLQQRLAEQGSRLVHTSEAYARAMAEIVRLREFLQTMCVPAISSHDSATSHPLDMQPQPPLPPPPQTLPPLAQLSPPSSSSSFATTGGTVSFTVAF